jgi:hypothetical protein
MRSDDTNASRGSNGEELAPVERRVVRIRGRRREQDRRLRACARAVFEDGEDCRPRNRDKRQIDRHANGAQRRIRALAENAPVVRVDREKRTLKRAAQDVLHHDPSD